MQPTTDKTTQDPSRDPSSNNRITFKAILNLDENWASHLSKDELAAYLKARLNSSTGLRGQVERFSPTGYEATRQQMNTLTRYVDPRPAQATQIGSKGK